MTEPISNINSHEISKAFEKHKTFATQDDKDKDYIPVDPLLLAYMCVFHAVQLSNQTADIQAKQIENNVNQQNELINLESQFRFFTLKHSDMFNKIEVAGDNVAQHTEWTPKKVTQTKLNYITEKNQGVSAIRNLFEDKIRIAGQQVQMDETKVNTTTNNLQQSMQEGSGILQMMTSLTNQIAHI